MSSSETSSSRRQLDVLTVGHALVDVLTGTEDAFVHGEGLVKGSMNLIDDDRASELYDRMGPAAETSGGSAANTATGVVACGGTAGFVGTVADDELGQIFVHDIRSSGVYYATPTVSGIQTGRSLILITPDGERTMNTNIGASARVAMNHLEQELLESASITYVEGYLFDDNHPVDGWTSAIKTIKAANNRFSITLSDSFCVERHREAFLNMLDGSVDICFGNDEEVCALFQVQDFEQAISELEKRCEVVAITLGARGSILSSNGSRVEVKAEHASVVDTTGAGDLYASGVLTGLSQGWSLERSGKLGSKAAAAVIGRMGARLTVLPL